MLRDALSGLLFLRLTQSATLLYFASSTDAATLREEHQHTLRQLHAAWAELGLMRRLFCNAVADFASAAIRRYAILGGRSRARPTEILTSLLSPIVPSVPLISHVHRQAKSLCEDDLYTQQRQPLEAWYNDHLGVFLADVLCEHGLRSGTLVSTMHRLGNSVGVCVGLNSPDVWKQEMATLTFCSLRLHQRLTTGFVCCS